MSGRRARKVAVLMAVVVGALAAATSASAVFSFGTHVLMEDRCEPASFDAVLGAGTCVGSGKVTFQEFIASLQSSGVHPFWRNVPQRTIGFAGSNVTATNIGGEEHTFTEVQRFGGGFVDVLNALSRNPVPAPACASTLPDGSLVPAPDALATLAAPGEAVVLRLNGRGVHNFMCCIHPWMRTSVFTFSSLG